MNTVPLNGTRATLPASGGTTGTVNVLSYVSGSGSDESVGLQNAVNAAIAQKVPLVGAAITVATSVAIDMRHDNLIVHGNGMVIQRNNFTGPVVYLGGTQQYIEYLYAQYPGQASLAQTLCNGFEYSNLFEGYYSNLTANLCYNGHALSTVMWNSNTTNTVFSTTFINIFANGWTNLAWNMQSQPPGAAASTGNVYLNFYFHNNFFGSAAACNGYAVMIDHDEGFFGQWNCEWGIPGGDLIFMQRCKNMSFQSMHFEGIQLGSAAGDIALLRGYENCTFSVVGLTFTNSTIVNSANNKSIFRAQQISGSPMNWFISGVRVRSLTNASTNGLAVFSVEAAGAGALRADILNCDNAASDGLTGASILGDSTGLQVRRLNGAYRGGLAETRPTVTGAKASNAALTSLMSTLAGLGLVTDSTT